MLPSRFNRPVRHNSFPPSRRDFSEKRKPSPLSAEPLTYSPPPFSTATTHPYTCEWVPVELHHDSDPKHSSSCDPSCACRSRSRMTCIKMLWFTLALVLLGVTWTTGLKMQMEQTIRNRNDAASSMLSQRSMSMVGIVGDLETAAGISWLSSSSKSKKDMKIAEKEVEEGKGKTLVVYSYTESRQGALQNAEFFLETALYPRNTDFVFVINGDAPLFIPKLSEKIRTNSAGTSKQNIHIVQRSTRCLGYGAYGDAISYLSESSTAVNEVDETTQVELRKRSTNSSIDGYSKFIFLDDTVKGPYVTSNSRHSFYVVSTSITGEKDKRDASSKEEKLPWTDVYTSLLSSRTKLQGVTYNCGDVETVIDPSLFATDRVGLDVFLRRGLLKCFERVEEVENAKVGFTRWLKDEGFATSVYTMGVRNVRQRAGTDVRYCEAGDGEDYRAPAGGVEFREFETMFVKVKEEGAMRKWRRWGNGEAFY